MGLTVQKEIQGSTTRLIFKGMLDITTCGVIEPFLKDIESVETLIFDFSDLEFIDSTGIGAIMNAIYLGQEYNFTLELTGVNELTHQVFETIGLYQILETIQEEEA